MTEPHILLVGNGPYSNRGCEAIVRGTMVLLRKEFGDNICVHVASFGSELAVAAQATAETDPLIHHIQLAQLPPPMTPPLSAAWWRRQWWRTARRAAKMAGINPLPPPEARPAMDPSVLDEALATASLVLQVGGDNYSLDYGLPTAFMAIDNHCWRRGIPVALWGASVGPFHSHPAFAREIHRHLQGMAGIFVRESLSWKYLVANGIRSNLHRAADPAFVMPGISPADESIPRLQGDTIGINLSPLMARYATTGDLHAWVNRCVEIVDTVRRGLGMPVLLVPHVDEDATFLEAVHSRLPDPGSVTKPVAGLNAAETKWVISRCRAFIGARTHSTIAAFSSGVPTISLAYSQKAFGLNRDIFGVSDYCLPPETLTSRVVIDHLERLLATESAVRDRLLTAQAEQEHAAEEAMGAAHDLLRRTQTVYTCGCRICRSR